MKHIFLSFLISLSLNLAAQDTPKAYVKEAISIMKDNSVNRGKIDWIAFNKEAMDSVAGKTSLKEAQVIVKSLLTKLGDSHSKFVPEIAVRAYYKTYTEQGMTFPYPKDSLINTGLAYLEVPAIGNFNSKDWELYVSDFYKKVKQLESKHPKAWLIDVRENDGGMFAPMFKALEPFLDAKNTIGSKDNSGVVNYYNIDKDRITFGKMQIASIKVPVIKLRNKNIPVYMLASKKTSSSGEFVIASFVGQNNARIVGVNTQGLTSDNSDFKLSDGSIIILTTGTLVDRRGHAYSELGKGIAPDIKVKGAELSDYVEAVKSTLK